MKKDEKEGMKNLIGTTPTVSKWRQFMILGHSIPVDGYSLPPECQPKSTFLSRISYSLALSCLPTQAIKIALISLWRWILTT